MTDDERLRAELTKLIAEIGKLTADRRLTERHHWLYPVVVSAGLLGAGAALAAALITIGSHFGAS